MASRISGRLGYPDSIDVSICTKSRCLAEKKMSYRDDNLRFPRSFQSPPDSGDEYDDEFDDGEAWEVYAELLKNEDYPGLVELCEREVARCGRAVFRTDEEWVSDDL